MELNYSSQTLEEDCPSTTLHSHESFGCRMG